MIEQFKKIGKTAHIKINGLVVHVEVLDFKQSYGRDRWLVTPVSGDGEVWIENLEFTK